MAIFDAFRKNRILGKIAVAFPKELKDDLEKVVSALLYSIKEIEGGERKWIMSDGETVTIPYRIDVSHFRYIAYTDLNERQMAILHCIYTRSLDGFVREGHLKELLRMGADKYEWAKPYVVSLTGEYVKQILDTMYEKLEREKIPEYRAFCKLNFENTRYLHARMMSYWAEFYRNECYYYKDYIGKKLFSEFFGVRKSGQKQIEINERNKGEKDNEKE